MGTKRKRSTEINSEVRKIVKERDSFGYPPHPCCILCGSPLMLQIHHFIPRSLSGLGIPENLVTLCLPCHDRADHGKPQDRRDIERLIKEYLQGKYPDFDEAKLVYKREF